MKDNTTAEFATLALRARSSGGEDIRISYENDLAEYKFYKFEKKIPITKLKRYALTGNNYKQGKVIGVPYSAEVHLTEHGYVTDKKLYGPVVGKEYKRTNMWVVEIDWRDQDHWSYNPDKGEVYRIKMVNREEQMRTIVRRNMFGYKPSAILSMILEGEIKNIPSAQEGRRISHDIVNQALPWSVEMDGKNILAIMLTHPKMTYNEVVNIIKNEGGSIDAAGIIHRA